MAGPALSPGSTVGPLSVARKGRTIAPLIVARLVPGEHRTLEPGLTVLPPSREPADPTWMGSVLTMLLVVPCGSVAVLFALEIGVLWDPRPRRLIAAGAALLAPAVLLLLAWANGRFVGAVRWQSLLSGAVWFLTAVGLVAVPLAARLGLGARRGALATEIVRDVRIPITSEIVTAVAIGAGVGVVFLGLAVFSSWFGRTGSVALAGLAVGVGLATLPISFYAIALSYDVPVGPGDDPLADTAQTLAFTWFVAAPMAAVLAGLALAGGGIRSGPRQRWPVSLGPESGTAIGPSERSRP